MRSYLCLVLFFLSATFSWGGDSLTTIAPSCIPTPNAATLARYADIPMNYYTGRANIELPLFSLDERGVKVHIKLNYDTQGLLANSLPGWTGHNWTLSAGGVITRVKNAHEDEFPFSNNMYHNFFYKPDQLYDFVSIWEKSSEENLLLKCDSLWMNIRKSDTDSHPDVFYFNFMGKTGRFFFGPDGQWKVLSDDNIRVVFDVKDENNYILPYFKYVNYNYNNRNKQRKTIKGFTLIDENGTKYIFGDNSKSSSETNDDYELRASAIEYSQNLLTTYRMSTPSNDMDETFTASAWYLTEIRDRFDNILYKFEYERGMFQVQVNRVDTEDYNINLPSVSTNLYSTLCLNSPVHLSKISMPLSKKSIQFTLDENRVLTAKDYYPEFCKIHDIYNLKHYIRADEDPVKLYYLQTDDSCITKYQYHHSANTSDFETNKIINPLASIGIGLLKNISLFVDNNSVPFRSYDFVYNGKEAPRLLLKEISCKSSNIKEYAYKFNYNSFGTMPKDYWATMTDFWGYYNNSLQDANPNPELTKYGMLKSIEYPTGGVAEISYEPNHYHSYYSKTTNSMINAGEIGEGDPITGGLAISKITLYEDSTKEKELSSRTFSYSGGELYALPRTNFFWSPRTNDKIHILETGRGSVIPLFNSFGPHIGYSCVTETFSDSSFRKYHYLNISDQHDERPVVQCDDNENSMNVFSERGYKRGKISSEEYYDRFRNQFSITDYYYSENGTENRFVYNTNLTHRAASSNPGTIFYTGGVYKMFYPKFEVDKIVTYTRHGDANVVEYKEFKRENKQLKISGEIIDISQLISETTVRGSDRMTTVYDYPNTSEGIANLKLTNQFFLPAISSKCFYNNKLINGEKRVYGYCNGNFVPMYDIKFANDSTVCDTIAKYKSYSSNFRIKEMEDIQNITHKYFWNSTDNLLAIASNVQNKVYLNTSAKEAKNVLTDYYSDIFGSNPTDVSMCMYNDKGLLYSIAKGNGQTTYYNYDIFNRLATVEDLNHNKTAQYSYNYRNTNSGENIILDNNAVKLERESESYPVSRNIPIPIEETSSMGAFDYKFNQYIKFSYRVSINAQNAYLIIGSNPNPIPGGMKLPCDGVLKEETHSVSSYSNGTYYVSLFVDGVLVGQRSFGVYRF